MFTVTEGRWEVVIDLPLPPSVNRFQSRLGNKSVVVRQWVRQADIHFMMERRGKIAGAYEMWVSWGNDFRGDIDNRVKPLSDYLQRVEVIENDKLCRRLLVDHDSSFLGCRVRLRRFGG